MAAKPLYAIISHFLYGLFTGVFYFALSPWFAVMNYIAFHVYEFVEFFLIRDRVYHDLREYYAGLCAGGLVWMLLT